MRERETETERERETDIHTEMDDGMIEKGGLSRTT